MIKGDTADRLSLGQKGRLATLIAVSRCHMPEQCLVFKTVFSLTRAKILYKEHLMTSNAEFVGIDVSKQTLDVATWTSNEYRRFSNEPKGIQELIEWLKEFQPELIVSGSHRWAELPFVGRVGLCKMAVAVVNPRRIREFARSIVSWPKQISWMQK